MVDRCFASWRFRRRTPGSRAFVGAGLKSNFSSMTVRIGPRCGHSVHVPEGPFMAAYCLTWSASHELSWTIDLSAFRHWNMPTNGRANRLRDIQADRPLSYPRLGGTWSRCESLGELRQAHRESRSKHPPRRAIRRLRKPMASRIHRKTPEEPPGWIQTSLVCLVPNGVRPCSH